MFVMLLLPLLTHRMPFVWVTTAERFQSFIAPMPLKFLGKAFDSRDAGVRVTQYVLSLRPMISRGSIMSVTDSRSKIVASARTPAMPDL
jgi:hypothetical protein